MDKKPLLTVHVDKEEQTGKESRTSMHNSFLPVSLYFELIKAKQTFLLTFTAVFSYLISASVKFNFKDFFWVFTAIFFAVSGSTLLNMYIDRDIDKIMKRTKNRPLPSGLVSSETVIAHGIVFSIAGIAAAGVFLNLITMAVVFIGFFFDVVIYSMWLKRRTKYSIIFGGIAGGLPAIAGRVAVTNSIDIISLLIGIFILLWIPLHILTLALIPENLQGYSEAKVPMWPVVSGKKQTLTVITLSAISSSVIAVIISFLLNLHKVSLILMIIFGTFVSLLSIKNLAKPTEKTTWLIFKIASIFMGIAFLLWYIGVMV
ncbi:MAG: heme o synthase [Candidatus Heimdallarchaeaceae archaeon]